jgi:hypothetical protein
LLKDGRARNASKARAFSLKDMFSGFPLCVSLKEPLWCPVEDVARESDWEGHAKGGGQNQDVVVELQVQEKVAGMTLTPAI